MFINSVCNVYTYYSDDMYINIFLFANMRNCAFKLNILDK